MGERGAEPMRTVGRVSNSVSRADHLTSATPLVFPLGAF